MAEKLLRLSRIYISNEDTTEPTEREREWENEMAFSVYVDGFEKVKRIMDRKTVWVFRFASRFQTEHWTIDKT